MYLLIIFCITNSALEINQELKLSKYAKWSKKLNRFLQNVVEQKYEVARNENTQVKYEYLKTVLSYFPSQAEKIKH